MNHFEIKDFFDKNLDHNHYSDIINKLSDAVKYSSTGGEVTSEIIEVLLFLKYNFPDIYNQYNKEINDFFNHCNKIAFIIKY